MAYVKLLIPINAGKPRVRLEAQRIYNSEDFLLDNYTLKIYLGNGTIEHSSRADYNKQEEEDAAPKLELDFDVTALPEPEEEASEESEETPVVDELQELWDSAQVAGSRSRYCGECQQIHSSKQNLFDCDHVIDEEE